MKKLPAIFGAVASLAASGIVQAAVLEGVQGEVRVNRGDGYVATKGATELKPGDMVMVEAKGKARLVYPDGCDVGVKAGSVTVIGAKSPCSQWTAQFPGQTQDSDNNNGPSNTTLVIGGVVVAGAIAGGVVAATSGGHHNNPTLLLPISP
ncbi:MAG: hypothetical protein HYS06_06340 [Methylocystis sp.]|nr:hypothetical protein [Methylocystis sp.]